MWQLQLKAVYLVVLPYPIHSQYAPLDRLAIQYARTAAQASFLKSIAN
jgi:hypothetical protein